jgi:hypothetical protein
MNRTSDGMTAEDLDRLIEQIITDAYEDDEQLWAFHCALEDGIELPCDAFVIGEPVSRWSSSTTTGTFGAGSWPDANAQTEAWSSIARPKRRYATTRSACASALSPSGRTSTASCPGGI